MPRNSSGVYSLPNPPFTANTTIVSAIMNSDLSDIATALTGSLPTNGSAPMTAALLLTAGTVSAPALAFSSYPATGMYLYGANEIGFAVNGVNAAFSDASGNWTLAGALTAGGNVTGSGTATFNGNITSTTGGLSLGASVPITIGSGAITPTQCRLTLSGSNLLLSPYQGNLMYINGNINVIPSSGVSLPPTGLTANVFYYIYVYMNSGTMTLYATTTGYTVSTTTGLPNLTGDATKALVGAVYTTTGPAFVDSGANRQVISYYNRKGKQAFAPQTSSTVNLSTSGYVDITTQMHTTFICWADELCEGFANVTLSTVSTNGVFAAIQFAFDGTKYTASQMAGTGFTTPSSDAYQVGLTCLGETNLTEGALHTATVYGQSFTTSTNTAYSSGNASSPYISYTNVKIMG